MIIRPAFVLSFPSVAYLVIGTWRVSYDDYGTELIPQRHPERGGGGGGGETARRASQPESPTENVAERLNLTPKQVIENALTSSPASASSSRDRVKRLGNGRGTRTLHGGRSMMFAAGRTTDRVSIWAEQRSPCHACHHLHSTYECLPLSSWRRCSRRW